jgi:hypothetical protein
VGALDGATAERRGENMMRERQSTSTPRWFFRLMVIFTATQWIWGSVCAAYVLTDLSNPQNIGGVWVKILTLAVVVPIGLAVSIMVLRRTPGNITGLLLLLWLNVVIASFIPRNVPIGAINSALNVSWVSLWMIPTYFPDGRPFPKRFGNAIITVNLLMLFTDYAWIFTQPHMTGIDAATSQIYPVANPLYTPALAGLRRFFEFTQPLTLLLSVLIVFTIVLRYRQADYRTRQQIKWLMWVMIVIVAIAVFLVPLNILNNPFALGNMSVVFFVVFTTFLYLAPFIAVGNAILRHNLYDIDIIIRRTLIYSALSGLLALVFFGGVTLTQAVFRSATGEGSDLAIVVSTLAIAALFTPLRRRVQNAIDRRFYRRKYDAERTLTEFAALARDEVDVEKLKAALIEAIQETMQPRSVGVWVRVPNQVISQEQTS